MKKTVTSCNDCPFVKIEYNEGKEWGSSCKIQPDEYGKGRPTLTSSSPDWCPLKNGPITIGLVSIPDSEYQNRITELLKPYGFEYAYRGVWINNHRHRIHLCWPDYDSFYTTFAEHLTMDKLINYLKENPKPKQSK